MNANDLDNHITGHGGEDQVTQSHDGELCGEDWFCDGCEGVVCDGCSVVNHGHRLCEGCQDADSCPKCEEIADADETARYVRSMRP